MTEPQLPSFSLLESIRSSSTNDTNDTNPQDSQRELTEALSLLFEPSPTLTEHIVPLLIQRLRSISESGPGSGRGNYAMLIDLTIWLTSILVQQVSTDTQIWRPILWCEYLKYSQDTPSTNERYIHLSLQRLLDLPYCINYYFPLNDILTSRSNLHLRLRRLRFTFTCFVLHILPFVKTCKNIVKIFEEEYELPAAQRS